ncbi:MAG: oxidoreductase [Planctomycetaceae bacterium]
MVQHFKTFRIHEDGKTVRSDFEQLSLDDLTEGDVVIETQFSSINYKDALAGTGKGRILRTSPLVGGIDVAGVVASSANDSFNVGDEVLVTGCGLSETYDGGYSQYVRARSDWIIPLPAGLTLHDAMALGTAGFTAALAIHQLEHNGLVPEQGPVVVTGATGGVGSLAVNMLAGLGYETVGVSGKPNAAELLTPLGVSEVLPRDAVDYGSRPLEAARWAGAIDSVGGETLAWLTRTMKQWGSIASIGLAGSHELHTTVMPFILRGVNLLGINSVETPRDVRLRVWERLATDLKPSKLNDIASQTIEFDQLPEAFEAFMNGTATGRTVVRIG